MRYVGLVIDEACWEIENEGDLNFMIYESRTRVFAEGATRACEGVKSRLAQSVLNQKEEK